MSAPTACSWASQYPVLTNLLDSPPYETANMTALLSTLTSIANYRSSSAKSGLLSFLLMSIYFIMTKNKVPLVKTENT